MIGMRPIFSKCSKHKIVFIKGGECPKCLKPIEEEWKKDREKKR